MDDALRGHMAVDGTRGLASIVNDRCLSRPERATHRSCHSKITPIITLWCKALGTISVDESSKTYPHPRGLAGPEIVYFWVLNGPSYRKTHWWFLRWEGAI